MVRPFNGFMAEDGSVYDTEEQCEAYEAAFNLHKAIRKQELVTELDELSQNYIITEVVKFISSNKDIVARYIEAGSSETTIVYQLEMFDYGKERLGRALRQADAGGDPAGISDPPAGAY